MDFSPEFAELAAALAKAQGAYGLVKKSREATIPGKDGKTGYGYKYADLADVLAAVTPALSANGLCLLQSMTPGESRGWACITTRLVHSSGQFVVVNLDLPVTIGRDATGPTVQALGSAMTYGRRYALGALLGIAAEEDDDGAYATQDQGRDERRDDPRRDPKPAPARGASNATRQQPATTQNRQQQAPPPATTKPKQENPAAPKTAAGVEADILARAVRYLETSTPMTRAQIDKMPNDKIVAMAREESARQKQRAAEQAKVDVAKGQESTEEAEPTDAQIAASLRVHRTEFILLHHVEPRPTLRDLQTMSADQLKTLHDSVRTRVGATQKREPEAGRA
jgi:hypothetical protein